jgi:hypothetical protein
MQMFTKVIMASGVAAAALMAPPAHAASIVTNGGFETGNFSGWTQFGNTGATGVTTTFNGVAPFEGSFQGAFGPVGSTGGIFQTLATGIGQAYSYSFSAAINNILVPPTLSNAGRFGYTTYSGTFTATSLSTDLRFTFRQDPAYYYVDAVSVAAVPEPATWAMMIGGFGIAGMALRRRRRVTVSFA